MAWGKALHLAGFRGNEGLPERGSANGQVTAALKEISFGRYPTLDFSNPHPL